MPSWLTELLKLLGFTTPLIYAAATYGFFLWLDKKASGLAKRAISGWLEPTPYDKAAVAAAILELFDKVYTRPLLAWRAFRRSALITTTVIVVGVFEITLPALSELVSLGSRIMLSILFMTNIMSDYVALFVIRWLLITFRLRPVRALILGPLVGILLVLFMYAFFILLIPIMIFEILKLNFTMPPVPQVPDDRVSLAQIIIYSSLIVHLWLPFFSISVALTKMLTYVLLAAKRVQWFLKRGKDHPLEAIGFVAAPLAFFIAVGVQVLLK